MEYTYTFKIYADEIRFECYSTGTRTGFKHVADMYIGTMKCNSASIHYYNSTSEQYVFQSVMIKCVRELMEQIEKETMGRMKKENGWGKMTAGRRAEISEALSHDFGYMLLCHLATAIERREYISRD